MKQNEIIEMTRQAANAIPGYTAKVEDPSGAVLEFYNRFAKLVAEAERKEMQAKIETLYAMYELVTKQRDYLMDLQSAQVAAMRGRVQ